MLHRKLRIQPKSRVQEVLEEGMTEKHPLFIVKTLPQKNGLARFSIAIAKKIRANTVYKNRLRRRVYEGIRLAIKKMKKVPQKDFVFLIRKDLVKIPADALQREIHTIMERYV